MNKETAKEKVVLAYSGGLDTSVCVKWLQEELGYDVICVLGNVGQEHDGLEKIEAKAKALGVVGVRGRGHARGVRRRVPHLRHRGERDVREQVPRCSPPSRGPLISKHLVDAAHKYGATAVAHGCTGKGNDQVRFETSIMALDPALKVIAPVREWDLGMRPDEIAYAKAHGVPVPVSLDKPYSIDDNLWGRAIEAGVLEDPWNEPPADIWTMTVDPHRGAGRAHLRGDRVRSGRAGEPERRADGPGRARGAAETASPARRATGAST